MKTPAKSIRKALLAALSAVSLWLLAAAGCESDPEPEAIDLKVTKTHENPFSMLDQEWEDYGNGDPFVMRHDGKYYLYVSTKDGRPGIKAWSSDNLLDWTYEGLVTEHPVSTGAYAPEVVYWNGSFYLYTSPAGRGHYVFQSDSPIGPFEPITPNLGMSIDGSVFIDDDGKWYFTHAGSQGIVGVEMESPYVFGASKQLTPFLGHWTEGSMIIKRNGYYFMTYTGNHVFSKGYRINYAVAADSPFGTYAVPDNNPLVISTAPDFHGLGHSSTVLGPDLDSYYLVYHNLVGRSAEGPPVRKMNIDRLVFNGAKMDVLGPTNYPVPAPKGPDFADRLDGGIDAERWAVEGDANTGTVVSTAKTDAIFTAEFNFRMNREPSGTTRIGALFSHTADGYASAVVDPSRNEIFLEKTEDGRTETLAKAALPGGLDWTKLHTLRVEKGASRLIVYVDQLKTLDIAADGFPAGSIGYVYADADPVFSFTAFSNDAAGTSDFELFKPLPGTIEAVHYLKGENRGFHVKKRSEDAGYRPGDGVVVAAGDGSHAAALQSKGDWLRYKVNVSEAGTYAFDIVRRPSADPVKVELFVDDGPGETFEIAPWPGDGGAEWVRQKVGSVRLPAGYHTIRIRLEEGSLVWKTADFFLTEPVPASAERVLESAGMDDVHGLWHEADGGYKSISHEDAKMYGGSTRWTDYRIEAQVKFEAEDYGEAGVLFRTTNESHFPDQVSDALMGYFVSVNSAKIQLYRHNYDSEILALANADLQPGVEHRLRIEAVGSEIKVFLNDMEKPVIVHTDPNAFLFGRVGIRSNHATHIVLSDLKVSAIEP